MDWLIDRWIDWLINWLIDGLKDWLIDWFIDYISQTRKCVAKFGVNTGRKM